MSARSYMLSEPQFISSSGTNECYLRCAVTLLLTCEEFCRSLSETKINCNHNKKKSCITCCTKQIVENYKKQGKIDLDDLEISLSEAYNTKKQFVRGEPSDAVEALFAILNSIHCTYLKNDSQGLDEEVVSALCQPKCPAHSVYSLYVEETYECKCGSKTISFWDYSNFCQYFNICETLSNLDYAKVTNISDYPTFKFKTDPVGDFTEFQGKLQGFLKSKLEGAQAEFCERECKDSNSKISFKLEHLPKVYLLNIIWDQNISHLDVFVGTVSITDQITMKDIYMNSATDPYYIKGIVFYGREHYEYAYRMGEIWYFRGLENNCRWSELLKEVVIMKYNPVCLVYEKNIDKASLKIENYKLSKVAKIALECDHFSNQFNKPVIPLAQSFSGLHNVPKYKKKQEIQPMSPKDHQAIYESRTKLLENPKLPKENDLHNNIKNIAGIGSEIFDSRPLTGTKIETSKKESIYNHKEDLKIPEYKIDSAAFEVKQVSKIPETKNPPNIFEYTPYVTEPFDSKKLKPESYGTGNEAIVLDTSEYKPNIKNESYQKPVLGYQKALFDKDSRGPDYGQKNYFGKEIKFESPYQKKETFDYNSYLTKSPIGATSDKKSYEKSREELFENFREKTTPKPPEIKKPVEPEISIWNCKCGGSNLNDWDICPKCDNLKPGLSGWVCKSCKFRNENDYSTKCKSCYIKRGEEKNAVAEYWQCISCKSYNNGERLNCSNCNVRKSKDAQSPTKVGEAARSGSEKPSGKIEDLGEWKCSSCLTPNRAYKDKCFLCNQPKNLKPKPEEPKQAVENYDIGEWQCYNCKKTNRVSRDKCAYCGKSKISSPEEKKKNDEWVCKNCYESNKSYLTFCQKCYTNPADKVNIESKEIKPSYLVGRGVEPSNIDNKVCRVCGTKNLSATSLCSYCRSPFESVDRGVAIQKSILCKVCNKESKIIDCRNCGKSQRNSDSCTGCGRSLKDIDVCSSCSEKIKIDEKKKIEEANLEKLRLEKARKSSYEPYAPRVSKPATSPKKPCKFCKVTNTITAIKCIGCRKLL